MIHQLAELVSLWLSVPAVILSVAVVLVWMPAAHKAMTTAARNATQWFAMGVTVGFIGGAIDNLYWMVPWTFHYLEMTEHSSALFNFGVYSNIPFRQICTLLAAYCHIRSALAFTDKDGYDHGLNFVNLLFAGSVVAGGLYAGALLLSNAA